MNSNDKMLYVPTIGDLDITNVDNVINALEENGVRRPIDSLGWRDKYPYHPLTTFSMAHSADTLFVDFFVRCNYLRAVNYKPNTPVYEDSCVGLSLQLSEDSKSYISLMINCIGTLSGKIHSADGTTEVIPEERLSAITCYASCGNRPFRELEGLFTWNILAEIPFKFLGIESPEFPLEMKGNFFKCASGTSQPHFLSWMPIDSPSPNFELPDYFGKITLE